MSLRAIARMKRENRELRERLSYAKKVEETITLTTWAEPSQRVRDEIKTARRLGYLVEVTADHESITLTAIKRVRA